MPGLSETGRRDVGRQLPRAHPRRPEAYGQTFDESRPGALPMTMPRTPRSAAGRHTPPAWPTRLRDQAGTRPGAGRALCPPCVLARIAATVGQVPHVLFRATASPRTGRRGVPSSNRRSTEIPELSERPDRYQFFGEIARGGMGAVLKGRDTDLGRDLAVKVLLESHRDKPELIRRFVEEAQIGGQLQHPGIVPVYELGTFADRRPFFTMKLVKGRTLAELARRAV